MGEQNKDFNLTPIEEDNDTRDMVSISKELLDMTMTDFAEKDKISIPIAELATLGGGVSSLVPAFRTITETTTIHGGKLYQLANEATGDVLKVAKDGNLWGAFKTAEGGSKFAKLKEVGNLAATTEMQMPFNPATMMMAAALFSIEKQLGTIEKTVNKMVTVMEIEKSSQIEGDLETLNDLISKYKHNWDNELFLKSSHKMVIDIQRSAREYIKQKQKETALILKEKPLLVPQTKVNALTTDLKKNLNYYRLSLYTFSMASFMEIMLSGNFKEEYINGIKENIEQFALDYRYAYMQASVYLEEINNKEVGHNILHGIGVAGKTVGNVVGKIPLVKEGQLDELLIEGGSKLGEAVEKQKYNALEVFAELSNPHTSIFTKTMEDMVQIYNHTESICMDKDMVYLVAK